MAWTRAGTVAVTNGSAVVTGTGTGWVASAAVGEAFNAPDGKLYEILTIDSSTQLTLGSNYLGATASAQAYSIAPTQSYIRDLAAQAAALLNSYSTIYSTIGAGRFPAGTVSAPSVRAIADDNTGVNLPGADVLQLVTGGVSQISIAADGTPSGPAFGKGSIGALGQWDGGGFSPATNGMTGAGRSTMQAPNAYAKGVTWEFKDATLMSGTGGQYGGVLTLAPLVGTTASTGGPNYQIAFRADGSMLFRAGIDATWGAFKKLATTDQTVALSSTVDGSAVELGTGFDLNTLTRTGPYWGLNFVNGPAANYWYVTVQSTGVAGVDVHQAAVALTGAIYTIGTRFERSRTGSGSWSAWRRFIDADTSGNVAIAGVFTGAGLTLGTVFSTETAAIRRVGAVDDALLAIFGDTRGPMLRVHAGSGADCNVTPQAILKLNTALTGGRSISAGGTINASGADYAEYHRTAEEYVGQVVKGQIVGLDAEDCVTLRFSDAFSFAIKSTDPSYVGGDTWGTPDALGMAEPVDPPFTPPLAGKSSPPAHPGYGEQPADDASDEEKMAFASQCEAVDAHHVADVSAAAEADSQAHDAAVAQAKAEHDAGPMAAYLADKAAFDAAGEAARQKVDRIAYSGRVPVNVLGAAPGDYIVAEAGPDDTIVGRVVPRDGLIAVPIDAVGRVRSILPDGRASVAVIIH